MSPSWFRNPDALVSPGWLERHLADPAIRVFDCTAYIDYDARRGAEAYKVISGRDDYDKGHIPGAGFLDLQADFSVNDSPYKFTLPTPEYAAAAFARHGVADGTRVILYSRGDAYWATRIWWMLRWLGFDDAAVLDGGFDNWQAENRPVSTDPVTHPEGTLTISPRPELFTGKDEVLSAIGSPSICTINAVRDVLHTGAETRFARPGHISGSVNIPAGTLCDPATKRLLPPADVARAFTQAGATPDKRVITYCGGGIAATMDAFALHLLGYDNIAVYDNSLNEWAADPDLPMEVG